MQLNSYDPDDTFKFDRNDSIDDDKAHCTHMNDNYLDYYTNEIRFIKSAEHDIKLVTGMNDPSRDDNGKLIL